VDDVTAEEATRPLSRDPCYHDDGVWAGGCTCR